MENRIKRAGDFIRRIGIKLYQLLIGEKKKRSKSREQASDDSWENPYIDDFREILMQILEQRNRSFRDLKPTVIDTDCPEQSFLTEDDVDRLLNVLTDGLNYLEIRTDRPEHFRPFEERVYQENGLLVLICPKNQKNRTEGNLILDLERHGKAEPEKYPHSALYIPFQKKIWKAWEEDLADSAGKVGQKGGNLDIAVPIGYNIVTVKIGKQNSSDRI